MAATSSASTGVMVTADTTAAPPELHLNVGESAADEASNKPATSFWSSSISAISRVAGNVEGRLAEWFGMNQSKFQWAVDSYMQERAVAAERKRLQTQRSGGGQMSAGRQQSMQRGVLPV